MNLIAAKAGSESAGAEKVLGDAHTAGASRAGAVTSLYGQSRLAAEATAASMAATVPLGRP